MWWLSTPLLCPLAKKGRCYLMILPYKPWISEQLDGGKKKKKQKTLLIRITERHSWKIVRSRRDAQKNLKELQWTSGGGGLPTQPLFTLFFLCNRAKILVGYLPLPHTVSLPQSWPAMQRGLNETRGEVSWWGNSLSWLWSWPPKGQTAECLLHHHLRH